MTFIELNAAHVSSGATDVSNVPDGGNLISILNNETAKFTMQGDSTLTIDLLMANNKSLNFKDAGGTVINGITMDSGDNIVIGAASGVDTMVFKVESAGTYQLTSGAAPVLDIDGSGNVDISLGSLTVATTLTVSSTSQLDGNVTIGKGAVGVDYTLTFDGETNDGVITWMEDEDYFQFADGVVMDGTLNVDGVLTVDTGIRMVALDGVRDNDWAGIIYNGESTANRSFGLNVRGGTSAVDVAFLVQDFDGGTTLLNIDGIGGTTVPVLAGSGTEVVTADSSGKLGIVTNQVSIPLSFEVYDAEPARGSESNIHGALLALATAQPLDSVPTNIVVTKGIGKLVIVVNAGSDLAGDITVTGTSVNRETGATTGADTDTITVDAVTTDGSDTDGNGNARHSFTGAYISAKWFTGTVTLSTANLTLTDVDVYHCSFEQFNDIGAITLNTFDVNLLTTNVNAEFDAYLYCLEVTGDKCDIGRCASLNVGTDGETAIANKYWRLRRGAIAQALDTTMDGVWADIHYSNSPAYIEDMSMKIWATRLQAVGA